MDARPKLLRYQTLNPGVGSGRDAHAWPYLTYLYHSPGLQGALRGALCCIARYKFCGVLGSSHVYLSAYHKARPSRAINEVVYYYYHVTHLPSTASWASCRATPVHVHASRPYRPRDRRRPRPLDVPSAFHSSSHTSVIPLSLLRDLGPEESVASCSHTKHTI